MKHIAILRQPFFDMVLCGKKTIESRWGMNRNAPYGKISAGDEILLKETGKSVTAIAKAKRVEFFELTPEKVEEIRQKYGKAIGTDRFTDWQSTLQKRFCTLVWLEDVKRCEPMKVPRSNGAGWIVLKD